MSWQDRPYSDDDGSAGSVRMAWPRPTTAVMWLLIANVAVFLVDTVVRNANPVFFRSNFGLSWEGLLSGQVWQLVTYMFVHHDGWHLLSNMLILYFFGIEVEKLLGRVRFLEFFGICGLIGGLAYLLLSLVAPAFRGIWLVGASGGCFGLIVAAMIFFPQMRIIFFFVPMTVRVFGLIMLGIHFVPLLGPEGRGNLGGEICHMAGAIAGVGVIYFWGMLPGVRLNLGGAALTRYRRGAWERRLRREAADLAEVDRILAKVGESGMQSLSRSERKILEGATRRQQQRDRAIDRMHRT
jgi:membrane associated rhomboid family serine protease